MSDQSQQQKAKVTQQENQLVKELTLLTYVVRTLVDEIKALRTELNSIKVIQTQVQSPVRPPMRGISNPLRPGV